MKRMKDLWQQLKTRWSQFSQREKKMIAIGGSALAIFLCYVIIWSPFLNHIADMRKKITSDKALLAWMNSADRVITELKKNEKTRIRPDSLVTFLSVLKQGVQEASLTKSLSQLRQAGNDSIEMHFQNVNFDQVIRFFSSILQKHDVHLAQFSVTALPTPGQTNIDIVMKVAVLSG